MVEKFQIFAEWRDVSWLTPCQTVRPVMARCCCRGSLADAGWRSDTSGAMKSLSRRPGPCGVEWHFGASRATTSFARIATFRVSPLCGSPTLAGERRCRDSFSRSGSREVRVWPCSSRRLPCGSPATCRSPRPRVRGPFHLSRS